jgi:hypothetical protein
MICDDDISIDLSSLEFALQVLYQTTNTWQLVFWNSVSSMFSSVFLGLPQTGRVFAINNMVLHVWFDAGLVWK